MRFQVLMAACMKMAVFWDVAPCSLPSSGCQEVCTCTYTPVCTYGNHYNDVVTIAARVYAVSVTEQ
jgi:hypothetical protein